MSESLVSIIIPARNEKYLSATINGLLKNARDIEIIAVLDGYWPKADELSNDPRVNYIHFANPYGMRNAINSAVALAKGKYLLKCDAHCKFADNFDVVLKADCQDNMIVVPRRYALDPQNWQLEANPKYPVDYMYLTSDLHGRIWEEKNKDPKLKDVLVDDLMTSQGSCWFMTKKYYHDLELLDEETYGTFWQEFQEIGLKAWLSGGRVVVNKKTWYAHWHKPSDVGRGYKLPEGEKERTIQMVNKWMNGKVWHKQKYDLKWLVEKFKPVPTWNI